MIGPKSWLGYPQLSLAYGIRTLERAESTNWGAGFYEPTNTETGLTVIAKVNPTTQSCFATEAQGSVRPTSGTIRATRLRGKKAIANKLRC